jgi:hypothetical protein
MTYSNKFEEEEEEEEKNTYRFISRYSEISTRKTKTKFLILLGLDDKEKKDVSRFFFFCYLKRLRIEFIHLENLLYILREEKEKKLILCLNILFDHS